MMIGIVDDDRPRAAFALANSVEGDDDLGLVQAQDKRDVDRVELARTPERESCSGLKDGHRPPPADKRRAPRLARGARFPHARRANNRVEETVLGTLEVARYAETMGYAVVIHSIIKEIEMITGDRTTSARIEGGARLRLEAVEDGLLPGDTATETADIIMMVTIARETVGQIFKGHENEPLGS